MCDCKSEYMLVLLIYILIDLMFIKACPLICILSFLCCQLVFSFSDGNAKFSIVYLLCNLFLHILCKLI